MTLSRDEFRAAAERKHVEREIKGVGKITLRQFSAREQADFLEMRDGKDHIQRARATWWLLAQCIVDRPNGERLFTSDADIDWLGNLSHDIVDAILIEITRLSDADPEAIARAGESSGEMSGSASESDSVSPTASRPPG